MLVRLLRDLGFDAYAYDKDSDMLFCKNFVYNDLDSIAAQEYDLIIALAVVEHLLDPGETASRLASMLSSKGCIFLSTTCYDKNQHDEDWDYLISEGGQHINFASKNGLRICRNRVICK